MKLYIVRHGSALDIGEKGIAVDEERPLSAKGKKHTRITAKALKKLKCIPEKIYTSPLVRASQTAAVIADKLVPDVEVEECRFLEPQATIASALDFIKRLDREQVMLVGHMPHLSDLASAILSGDEKLVSLDLDKSGACLIEWENTFEKSGARLVWMLDFEVCRLIIKK